MSLLARIRARLKEKKEDREAIAKEQQEELRAGDEPQETQIDTVGDAFDK